MKRNEKRTRTIFRTITDKEGKFIFKNLAYGDYQVYPKLPEVYKIIGFNNYTNDEHAKVSVYVSIRNNWSNQRQVFQLEMFGNLKGKI